LVRSHLSSAEAEPVRVRLDDATDPLDALRRRLARLALGGRTTIPPESLATVEREAALVERRMMPGGAEALRSCARAACAAERAATGARRGADATALAEAWLDASAYERAATRALRRAMWE
jgi:hypothetical protein